MAPGEAGVRQPCGLKTSSRMPALPRAKSTQMDDMPITLGQIAVRAEVDRLAQLALTGEGKILNIPDCI